MTNENLLRINKFKIEKSGFTTYTHASYVADVSPKTEKKENRKTSTLNDPNLVKRGNFYTWNFDIYRLHETDEEWETIVNEIKAFNAEIVTFTPDTVDTPSESLQCYIWSNLDKINEGGAGIERIFVEVIRVYSQGNEILLDSLFAKFTTRDEVSFFDDVFCNFYKSDNWLPEILSYNDDTVILENVCTDSDSNAYCSASYGSTGARRVRLIKTNIDGTTINTELGTSSLGFNQESIVRVNVTQNKVFLYRLLNNEYYMYACDTNNLSSSNIYAETNGNYSMNDFYFSNDDLFIYGCTDQKVTKIEIANPSNIIVSLTSYIAVAMCIDENNVVWRAASGTTQKISKFEESGGSFTETEYNNSDMQNIKDINIDTNGNIICLQRNDSTGDSKIFKVDATNGQTLHTLDFGDNKYIYNISIDSLGNYYCDQVDGATKNVFKINASTGAFNNPISIGDQAENMDRCDYTGYLI